ncbi:MAG: preprotein translocase subunit SecG [Puniceicoccales bacterium]|jgi:protein translocase SecG subunit|nr:preprotein translocase subunit SecG [Puniceicoccales bacterium]
MTSFLVVLLSLALILISLFNVLIILMQRPSEDAGMGSALGGGAVASIFGGEAGNILHRWTITSTILFFLLSLLLSMLYMAREGKKEVIMKWISAPESLAVPTSPSKEKTPFTPSDSGLVEGMRAEGISAAAPSPENPLLSSSEGTSPRGGQSDEGILKGEGNPVATDDSPALSLDLTSAPEKENHFEADDVGAAENERELEFFDESEEF